MQGVCRVSGKLPTARSGPKTLTWLVVGSGLAVLMGVIMILAIGMGVLVLYASQRILPGVSVAGVSLGSMTADEAAVQLEANWSRITIRDGSRTWTVPPSQVGMTFDANATALAAQARGRTDGSMLAALIGDERVSPVLTVDPVAAGQGIKALAPMVDMAPANATVRMVDGELTPVDAVEGRSLDVAATVNRLLSSPAEEMADGALDLVVNPVQPAITDPSALVSQVGSLLASPLIVNAYDPITNQTLS